MSNTDQTLALRLLLMRDLADNYASTCGDARAREGFFELKRMADEAQKLLPPGTIRQEIPPLRPRH